MKLSVSILSVLFALGFSNVPSAEAARHCNKGKPCGNSCISRDDVCHLDGGNAVSSGERSRLSRRDDRDDAVSVRTQSSSAEQSKAKVCKRGKACGNSCIPANAVCHQ